MFSLFVLFFVLLHLFSFINQMKSHLYGNTGDKVIIIIMIMIMIMIMSGTLLSNLRGRRKETSSVPPQYPLPYPYLSHSYKNWQLT